MTVGRSPKKLVSLQSPSPGHFLEPEKRPLLDASRDKVAGDSHVVTLVTPIKVPSIVLQVYSACLYGGTSVAMNFVNKYTMVVFPLTNLLVALQMACTWVILQAQKEVGVVTFAPFSWKKARQLSGITLLYTANTVFSLVGLKTLNVPMYNVLKRLTPMMILVIKAFYKRRWPEASITASVAMVVGGCIVAGIGDLTFDFWGYVYAILSCSCQALYLLIVEFQGADYGVDSTEMLYYNAVTSLPLLLIIAYASGEVSILPATYVKGIIQAQGLVIFWVIVLSCALMGMLLNYAQFLCTTTNTALTTTIVGVAKGVLAIFLGFFAFGGVPFSLVNITGITMNTLGVVWYTWIKYTQRAARDTPAKHVQSNGRAADLENPKHKG